MEDAELLKTISRLASGWHPSDAAKRLDQIETTLAQRGKGQKVSKAPKGRTRQEKGGYSREDD